MSRDRDCRIYVGNLPRDVAEYEISDLFDRWRPVRDISIKSKIGTSAYAFVTFDHPDDAADAVHYKDGSYFANGRIRVEIVKGPGGGRPGGRATRRGDFRVIVTGIPRSGSWQDLKDHMREAGDVVFTDISRDGSGVVEYSSASDMRYALDKMQDSTMRSRSGETGRITIKEDIDDSRENERRDDDRRDSDRRERSRSPDGRRSPPPADRDSREDRNRDREDRDRDREDRDRDRDDKDERDRDRD